LTNSTPIYNVKRRKRKPSPIKPLIGVLMLAMIILLSVIVLNKCVGSESEFPESGEIAASLFLFDASPTDAVAMPNFAEILDSELYSKHALLVRREDKLIVCKKDPDKKAYPASLTKMMTAIVVIENAEDLEAEATLSTKMFDYIYKENAATAGFKPKEKVKVIDLLYGILLPSGADAAIGAAEYIAGSEEKFAVLMNKKAKEIGMENTHFVNCTGLHDDNHYSTARDMAKLLEYALGNETFREIFTSKKHYTSATNLSSGITLRSTTFSSLSASGEKCEAILGGKTGFTLEGFQCLATLAEIDGEEYILVTLGAGEGKRDKYYHILDAVYVYNEFME